jgi:nucleoside-diphosphate-sugar epimerase
MSRLIVFGASGFIGGRLIKIGTGSIFPVTRNFKNILADGRAFSWLEADLSNEDSLHKILRSGDIVINLAYSSSISPDGNIRMAENLIKACVKAGVARLVHCSTAVVIGVNPDEMISENSECKPATAYEKNKYRIEKIFLDSAREDFTVCILRPTAVIGAGAKNLKKMLSAILHGDPVKNFVRAMIQGQRRLNLVPVTDVAKAMLFLSTTNMASTGVYICSADDDPDNSYDRVEAIIRQIVKKEWKIKPPRLPPQLLDFILKIMRDGSGRMASRHYSSSKLISLGFRRSDTITLAVQEFVYYELRGAVQNHFG